MLSEGSLGLAHHFYGHFLLPQRAFSPEIRLSGQWGSPTPTFPPSWVPPRRRCTITSPARPNWARASSAATTSASTPPWPRSTPRTCRPLDKLLACCDLYRGTLRGQRMCLCGMLAAEYNALGEPMREATGRFFDHNREWLAALLETGRKAGTPPFCWTGRPNRRDDRRGPRGSDAGGPSLPPHHRSRRCHRPASRRLRCETIRLSAQTSS